MTTEAPTQPDVRRHGTFHPLKVSEVTRLTDEAVAVTFEVPAELRPAYAFQPGQPLKIGTE